MKNMLFPISQSASHLLLGGVAALWLMVSPALQAQTNFNFNNTTNDQNWYPGWEFWMPEEYNAGGGVLLPSITFTTNDVSANNMAYYFHSGNYALPSYGNYPRVGSFYTNGAPLTNFTMIGEFFHWTNGQCQTMGLAGRIQLPLPATTNVDDPGGLTTNLWPSPTGFVLNYQNRRSYKWFRGITGTAAKSDFMRFNWIYPDCPAQMQVIESAVFSGPGESFPGVSLSPDATNGHYRIIFTMSGLDVTGQMVDLSTGLPMTFVFRGVITNILHLPIPSVAGGNAINPYPGGGYGFYATLNDGQVELSGTPIDPHFDNFAIVPGVLTLESAAAVDGPYTQDTSAGIELSPKRITVPVSGSTRFYRIYWTDCITGAPKITSITPGGPVNVVTGGPTTNVVNTLVLAYE